ncbi:peptidase inhibitor family I36 protein [Streptomyces sp. NPDC017943]|uniref:peptidase inhibitor family I36 protein n=1 Tax=Streptomyces sp. NPDC017943 TaxID=3365019 RepID=UPI0037B38C5F
MGFSASGEEANQEVKVEAKFDRFTIHDQVACENIGTKGTLQLYSNSKFEVDDYAMCVRPGLFEADMENQGLNDEVKSVRNDSYVTYCLYRDADFKGAAMEVFPGQSFALTGHYETFNDSISSLRRC